MHFHYDNISDKISSDIIKNRHLLSFCAFNDEQSVRRNPNKDKSNAFRTPFIRDIDKIMHCPYFNRYSDKTQVFSLYKNDDITRRSLHVQLVSRIARTIGKALNLNLDLIEAIALGHDMGHTPFAHSGESILNDLYHINTGRYFSHNIHSVRVLDKIFPYNITLQTLDGIACHDGELELEEYYPEKEISFDIFDNYIEKCYSDKTNIQKLVPSTLEGCVVRISDIIAYLGKDRQDAAKAEVYRESDFEDGNIGIHNAEIINNLMVNIIENSYGKPYIKMDKTHFEALKSAKNENYRFIYESESVNRQLNKTIKPMMQNIYGTMLDDLKTQNKNSPIFTHHISLVNSAHYERPERYEKTEPNQLVVDYIASMTDDYFIDCYYYLFPNSQIDVSYKGYFD